MKEYVVKGKVIEITLENGKVVKVMTSYIERMMEKLELDMEDAVLTWLEDEEYLINEMKYSVKVIKPIIEQIKKVLAEDRQIYLEGANKSFDLPEFNSLAVAKNFVNIIDEKDLMTDILNSGFAKDINVYIGDENEKEELKDFSVITFKHKVGYKEMGTIGIIGPKIKDYSKVISVMKYINKKLKDKGI